MSNESRKAFELWAEGRLNAWDYAVAWRVWSARDAEVAALKARVTFLEGTVKSILDHINRGNDPKRSIGMTDFAISQDRGMTISFIKRLAEEALR